MRGPAFAIIDGQKAIGMVSACKAMKLAIKKAKEVGIAYVGVKNSCHFGAAGYYANLAASEGLLGISMSNRGSCYRSSERFQKGDRYKSVFLCRTALWRQKRIFRHSTQ